MALLNIPHPDLSGFPSTNLGSSAAAGVTTLAVNNTEGFNSTDYGVISKYGTSNAEIIRLNGGITDTGFNIQVATKFAHGVDSQLTYIPYNQVAIEYSTDLTTLIDSNVYATITEAADAATWVTLITRDIQPSNDKTVYDDGDTTSRSYRFRFYNETTAVYSSYSDPILPTGYGERTVGRLIEKILKRLRKDIGQTSVDQLTYDDIFEEINNGIDDMGDERKQWSHRRVHDKFFADITPGRNYIHLPTDIDVSYSNRSLKSVKINDGKPLDFITKDEYDDRMEGVHHSTLVESLKVGSSNIEFVDTSNFPDSGSFEVVTGSTRNVVRFTANDRTTNHLTLTDASTDVTTTHAIGTDVWESATFRNNITEFTVFGRSIYFPYIPDTALNQRTVQGDYTQTYQRVNSESDIIKASSFTALFNYVLYAIEDSLDHAKAETYYGKYQKKLDTMKRNETTGDRPKFTINVNTGGKPVDPVPLRSRFSNTIRN